MYFSKLLNITKMKIFEVHRFGGYGEYLYLVHANSEEEAFNLVKHELYQDKCKARILSEDDEYYDPRYTTFIVKDEYIYEYTVNELIIENSTEPGIIVSGGYSEC